MPSKEPPIDLPAPLPSTDAPLSLDQRLAAVEALIDHLEQRLTSAPYPQASSLEELSLRHLAKASGTGRSALMLARDARHIDACILTRAVFEQLFTYLWIARTPERAEARGVMVTIKQEWANAKYLEGLAPLAGPEAGATLLAEAGRYKQVADRLMGELAAALGTTEKKVRDEATLRVSAKAVEVNLGPEFSVPYAYYSGFVHSDGVALAAYGEATPEGVVFSLRGAPPQGVPLASDLHRVLLRLAFEVGARCERFRARGPEAYLQAHAAWLAEADAQRSRAPE